MEWKLERYHNVTLTKIPSTRGVTVLKKVECVGRNDCEHIEHCNIAFTAALIIIKHYTSYRALLLGH